MSEISEERLKRVWKWCGLTYKTSHSTEHWYGPNGELIVSALGGGERVLFTLDSLFRWAVPKLLPKTLTMEIIIDDGEVFYEWAILSKKPSGGVWIGSHEDPATALLLAIEPLIKKESTGGDERLLGDSMIEEMKNGAMEILKREAQEQAKANFKAGYEQCSRELEVYLLKWKKAGMKEVAEWVQANVFTGERTLSLEDYNEWAAFLKEKGIKEEQ